MGAGHVTGGYIQPLRIAEAATTGFFRRKSRRADPPAVLHFLTSSEQQQRPFSPAFLRHLALK